MNKILIAFVIIIGMAMVGYIVMQLRQPESQTMQTTQTNEPTMKETNYAQDVPKNQQSVLIIKHDDSTYEKVIVPVINQEAFTKSLPAGDTLVGVTPAQ